MPPLQSYSITDKGLHRPNNEDCFLSEPKLGLWLVADGMGGHEAGEIASELTKQTVNQKIKQGANLRDAVLNAHQVVIDAVASGQGAEGMGSTIVALLTKHTHYQIAWVGDSRAYLWTETKEGGQLEQLSTDHSYVQMLLSSGSIEPEEVENHPDKNIITQCIGSADNPTLNVDITSGEWKPNQWLILCSDGLSSELTNQEMAQILFDTHRVKDAAQILLAEALNKGGKDNITIQVIESPLQTTQKYPSTVFKQPLNITGNKALDITLLILSAVSLLAIAAYWVL